jgi:hypothetical protein
MPWIERQVRSLYFCAAACSWPVRTWTDGRTSGDSSDSEPGDQRAAPPNATELDFEFRAKVNPFL